MGNFLTVINSQFPPKAKWTVDNVPDLTGKVACVTGGYGGIGYEISKALLQHGAKVYIAGRSDQKAKAAIAKLKQEIGKDCEVYFLQVDLADIPSIGKAAQELSTKEHRLDILINNAGVMDPPEGSKTKQGFELQWGTNVVGHYVLTKQLMPLLLFTAHRYPLSTRVVWVSSTAYVTGPKEIINFEDVSLPGKRRHKRYGQSKAAAILLANSMASHFTEDGLLSFSVHPGSSKTDLARTKPGPLLGFIEKRLMRPARLGAITPMYAATYPDFKPEDSGKFFIPYARTGKPGKKLQDVALANKLWEFLDRGVGELPDKPVETS